MSRPIVHVERFKSKEVGIKKLQEVFLFLCADCSLTKDSHGQRPTLRHQRVVSPDAGGVPSTLGEARDDPLCFPNGRWKDKTHPSSMVVDQRRHS